MANTTTLRSIRNVCLAATAVCSVASATAAESLWLEKTITPVTNPLYFEDPRITTEIRPIFANHWMPKSYHTGVGNVPLGGDVQVYAVQARIAITDRLAFIATKDGYYQINPSNTLPKTGGWANLAAGFKYALIDDAANDFILTPGLTFEIPTGNRRVFQGSGSGEWNPFVSVAKGYGNFHLTGNFGVKIPNDFSKQTAQLHYSLQADYYTCQYFIPFVAVNAQTVLSNGKQKLLGAVDLTSETSDIINFGSTRARGSTLMTVGAGFRTRLAKNLDAGIAYEIPAVRPVGLFESRITADVIYRF